MSLVIERPDGPPIRLSPTIEIWEELEASHGGSLGALFAAHRRMEPRLRFYHDLLFRCARHAGHPEDYKPFGERLYRLGLFQVYAIVGRLFEDLFKEPSLEEERKLERDADGPLVGAGSDAAPGG